MMSESRRLKSFANIHLSEHVDLNFDIHTLKISIKIAILQRQVWQLSDT